MIRKKIRQFGIIILATLFGFVWGVRTLLAQSSGFRGTVVNMASGRPIPGAHIIVGEWDTWTDDEGRYSLDLPAGMYDGHVEADGYISMAVTRQVLGESERAVLDIEMVPQYPTEEEEAVIEARLMAETQSLAAGADLDILGQEPGLTAVTEVPETIRVLMPDDSVVEMSMDEYLKGVVPREVSPSWPLESLRAQAVAARSYAANARRHMDKGADVCTDVHCQAWGPNQYATTNRAVDDTSGVAAMHDGKVINAFFHAHCDGHTRNVEDVWQSYLPYCRSVACPCGYTTRYGHGVGMCQQGSRAMALQGFGYEEILKHYYTGISVTAPPVGTLSATGVSPSGGDTNTLFRFQATYASRTGDPPAVANVHINGRAYAMLRTGGGAEGPWTYSATLRLPAGQHSYRFYFDDGHGRATVSATTAGPVVSSAPSGSPTPTPAPISPQGPVVDHAVHSTVADWETGTHSNTRVAALGDGALTLAVDQSQGTYTAPTWVAPFSFMALGLTWHAEYPTGSRIVFEVRTSADGNTWTAWRTLERDDDDPGRDNNVYSSDLLVAVGHMAQWRARLYAGSGGMPVLRNVRLVGIDAREGPTVSGLADQPAAPMAARPPIISRSAWGAAESPIPWPPEYRPPRAIVIHHTATGDGDVDPAAMVRAIYYYHAFEREWGDIGYNYLIDHMGNIYEGRAGGVGVVGGHARGYNYGSIGIALIGDHAENPVPQAALDRLTDFLAWQCTDHFIHPTQQRYFVDRDLPTILAHRDVANTTCPGDHAYGLMNTIRSQTLARMAAVPPNLALIAPVQGQSVRAVTQIEAQPSASVTRVEFYIDNVLRATRTAAPYIWRWNTTQASAGQHTVRVVAYNDAGQASQQVTVTVDNTPPTGSVSAPAWVKDPVVTFTISGSNASAVQFSNNWIWSATQLKMQSGVWNQGYTSVWYGPYTCALTAPGEYQVYYRLKTTDHTQSAGIALIDISDNQGQRVYAERILRGVDFVLSNTFEEFSLPLHYTQKSPTCASAGSGDGLEFRIWFSQSGNPALERVAVFSAPQPFSGGAGTVSWRIRDVEGEPQRVVVRLLDAAGNVTEREVTIRLDRTAPVWLERDERTALVQDAGSGLNVQSAEWSSTSDGGVTWTSWQPLTVSASMGTREPVRLEAPAPAGSRVRFRIRDVAGNVSESAPSSRVVLPVVRRQVSQ